MEHSRTTPFRSTLDDDYLLALELQREFDQQVQERGTNAEVNAEPSNALRASFTVDDLDEDYALAMQLQMEEEQQYQALHAREQKSSKRFASFQSLICSDR